MTAAAAVASAHDAYRDRLVALADGGVLIEAIGPSPGAAGCTQTWARFDPGRAPYATFVYDAGGDPRAIVQIEVFESRPPATADTVVHNDAVGWLRVVPFPADPLLPTLPALMAACTRPTVVRYRPGRRCTIRADRRGREQYAKVFAEPTMAERVHRVHRAVWRAAQRGELGFAVARPAGVDRRLGAVWVEAVAGAPVNARLFGDGDIGLAMRMGRAAGSLTRTHMRPRAVLDTRVQIELSQRRAAELVRRVPALRPATAELFDRLRRAHVTAGPRWLRPVHGAPHPRQWLVDGDEIALVDFDGLALGEPERDAASFVAAVAAEDRSRVPVERLNTAFLVGYESQAGPLDPALLAAYSAHRWLGKALKAACAARPDGDRRAERRIERALDHLEAGT